MSRCVFVYLSDPHRRSHGGTIRVRHFVDALQKAGVEVVLAHPASPSSQSETGGESRLRKLKRELLPMPTMRGATDGHLLQSMRDAKADFAVVSVASQWPMAFALGIPVWIDFMDVWSTFAEREAEKRRGLARRTALAQAHLLRDAEARYGRHAALVTSAGWKDHETLISRGVRSHWVPTSFESVPSTQRTSGDRLTPTVGFIGNFDYWPNVAAYNLFVNEWVEPLMRKGWHCLVAGLKSEKLAVDPRVENLGTLDDVNTFYDRVTATAAPIELGGGIKVKVVESLLRGRPVLTTPQAAEGLPPDVRTLLNMVHSAEDLPSPSETSQIFPDDPALSPFRLKHTERVVAGLLADRRLT